MFESGMHEEHLNYVFDGCIERINEITSKGILKDGDIEELKEIIEYLETDYDRRYFDRSEEYDNNTL